MKEKKKLVVLGKGFLDFLEIHLPAIAFLTLFVSFLIGIVFRYVFKNPQSWTFEVSSICYLAVGVLSWGIAHRTDENVVFDMLYERLSMKTKCILRIITNVLMAMTAFVLIYPSITYLQRMAGLTTQIVKIPRFIVFLPFTISFISATIRSTYRSIVDIRGLINKEYTQQYGREEKEI